MYGPGYTSSVSCHITKATIVWFVAFVLEFGDQLTKFHVNLYVPWDYDFAFGWGDIPLIIINSYMMIIIQSG